VPFWRILQMVRPGPILRDPIILMMNTPNIIVCVVDAISVDAYQ